MVRIAELLIGLSAVADLGMGQPVGSSPRTCYVAVALARAAGCAEDTVADGYFTALLQHIGCTAYSHEATLLFADELSIKRESLTTDFDRPGEVLLDYLPAIVRAAPPGGDKVVTRKSFNGRHVGDFMGIPATGREVTIELIDIVRIADGRIVEHWNVVDQLGLPWPLEHGRWGERPARTAILQFWCRNSP